MKNIDVIKKFIGGEVKGETTNLYIQGDNLINYSTIIAKRTSNGQFLLNTTKYSRSTSVIQNALKFELKGNYIEVLGKELNA